MLSSFLLMAVAIVPSLAAPELAPRQATTCNRDNLYRCFTASPAVASPFCASYTAPVTSTASTTITPTASTTVTVTNPITQPTTVPSTSTSTTFVTITSVATTTVITQTTTFTTVTTGVPSAILNRRAPAPSPACLTKDGTKSTSYSPSRITSACSCLYARSTTTVTPTAPTTTVTATATSNPVVIVTSTSTITVPQTLTITQFNTVTATSTNVNTAISTVAPSPIAYSLAVGPGASCTYNRYTDGFEADNSPDNNYAVGINQCAGYCSARLDCKFFFYIRFDPARARGADYGFCFIDNLIYDSTYLQCGYPTQKYVGYNKNF